MGQHVSSCSRGWGTRVFYKAAAYFSVSRSDEFMADDLDVDKEGDGIMVNVWMTQSVRAYL